MSVRVLCRSARKLLVVTLLDALMLSAPALAAPCPPDTGLWVRLTGTTARLGGTARQKVPYGRDLDLLYKTKRPARALFIELRLSGGRDGDRKILREAQPDVDSMCWSAPFPPIHLNESGSFKVLILTPATYLRGRSSETFLSDLLRELSSLPDAARAEAQGRVDDAIQLAANENFADWKSIQIAQEGQTRGLVDALGAAVIDDLMYTGIAGLLHDRASSLVGYLDTLLERDKSAMLAAKGEPCAGFAGIQSLRDRASILGSSVDSVFAAIGTGRLPWPRCASSLMESYQPSDGSLRARAKLSSAIIRLLCRMAAESNTETDSDNRRIVAALASLPALIARASDVTERAVQIQTLNVPVGAEELERFTQVDMVTAWLPDPHMVQAFAAATLYLFSTSGGPAFAAAATPSSASPSERFGVQVGYPVGSPLREAKNGFQADILLGGIVRLNSYLSLSGGEVFGQVESKSRSTWYLSTNLDVSNFPLFQNLFARRDP